MKKVFALSILLTSSILFALQANAKNYDIIKDKEYKEWFKQACDLAQRGYIFYAFTDGMSCFGNNHKMLLSKEPETGEYLPFPPAGEIE